MRKSLVMLAGLGLSIGVFAANQEIDFGVFASSSMTSYGNGNFTNNGNPMGEYLGYKDSIDKASYVHGLLSYSGYQSNTNDESSTTYPRSGLARNNQLKVSAIYGYNIQKELLMPVPTYIELGVGYGNWNLAAQSENYNYPSQINFNWFYVPIGLSIVNSVGGTTYTLKGGALVEVGGLANYNSFVYFPTSSSTGQNIASNSVNLDLTFGYYANFETAYQLSSSWILKWDLYYMNTPLQTTGNMQGIDGYTLGTFNNQNAGVACSLGYQF
ncbi:MAG: hypothetical protein NTX05_01295 [Fusobacteria bacterium]|nr:hypothetical protein [Fusobacteriota bacterium]